MPEPSPIAAARNFLLALTLSAFMVAGVAPVAAAATHAPSIRAKDRKATSPGSRSERRAAAKEQTGASIQIGKATTTSKKAKSPKRSTHEVTPAVSTDSKSSGSSTPTGPSTTTGPASTSEAPVENLTPTPSPDPAPVAEPMPVTEPAPVTEPKPITEPTKPGEVTAPVETANLPLMESGFEDGFDGWNTAGVGEVMPTLDSSMARTGTTSCRVLLTGNENRSELIFGGNGGSSLSGTAEFHSGEEFWYGFSFYINQMVYGKPGAHNLIMQFKSAGEGSPLFGLQLWNYNGKKGLWSSGTGMEVNKGGERFLSPVTEQAWHDVQIHFRASETGAGFYEVFLDGRLIDSHTGVTNIIPGAHEAYIKDGIYRNGETAAGTSEIHLDAAKLGKTQASVLPN